MNAVKRWIPWALLLVSVVLNVALGSPALARWFNGPPDRLGTLTRSVAVGSFSNRKKLFTLPKGLTVRDASPLGFAAVDLFEPHRFTIIVSTEDEALVDYGVPRHRLHAHEELYSVDSTGAPSER